MSTTPPGGNMNDVERQGDTVLRTAGPWTPTVHRYLGYLALAGVTWAPQSRAFADGEIVGAIDFDMCYSDVLRLAIIRLHDLAEMSRDKAVELGKPHLLDEAAEYELDAVFLEGLR